MADPHATGTSTANPYTEAEFKDALRRQYELGRKDGYDEAVKMIRKATQALQRDKKRAAR